MKIILFFVLDLLALLGLFTYIYVDARKRERSSVDKALRSGIGKKQEEWPGHPFYFRGRQKP